MQKHSRTGVISNHAFNMSLIIFNCSKNDRVYFREMQIKKRFILVSVNRNCIKKMKVKVITDKRVNRF